MMRMQTSVLLAGLIIVAVGCEQETYRNNSAPWADAGVSITTSVGLETVLDGSGSYDPDEGDTLTYFWSFESVPASSALSSADISPNESGDAVNPVFIADQQGLYVVRLRVNDSIEDSQSSFVHVMADIEGSLPIADAGDDAQLTEGDAVNLDGSGSFDPLGNDLGYSWYLVGVPDTSTATTADISDSDKVSASFVPDAPGTFLIGLQVNNGITDSIPDFVQVEVSSTNSCPEAVAAATSALHSCSDITVTAADSDDPDGDSLDYSWRHLLAPYESNLAEDDFADPTAQQTTFFATATGTYTLQVSVNDGECESSPFQFDVTISVRPTNTPPTPLADGDGWVDAFANCTQSGGDWWCSGCEEIDVIIDGSGSTDADGDPLTFHWENLYDPAQAGWENYLPAEIDDPHAISTTVTLQDAVAEYGETIYNQYEFMLTVTDCMGESVALADSFGIVYGCTGQ